MDTSQRVNTIGTNMPEIPAGRSTIHLYKGVEMTRPTEDIKRALRDEISRAQYIHDHLSEDGEPLRSEDAEFLRAILLGRARAILSEYAFTGNKEYAVFLHNYLDI